MQSNTQTAAAEVAALFYEGILDSEQWYAALDALRQKLQGVSFHQVTLATQSMAVIDSVTCDVIPEGKAEEYELHHADSDERIALISGMPDGQFMFDHHHFDDRHMSRSAIYADFLRPIGMRHALGMVLQRNAQSHDYMAVLRADDQKAYGDYEQALMEQLAPHMSRAARLRAQAGQLQRLAGIGATALDHLQHGIIVSDGAGRIQQLNQKAERSLQEARWCHALHGRLQLRDHEAQQRLEQALRLACQALPQASMVRTTLPEHGAAILRVLPLSFRNDLADLHPTGRQALVILSSPFQASTLPLGAIGEILGITPKETLLAQALAQGQTVNQFAATQNCSVHTARDHLKNLLAKTGCRRQIEVVQLMHALA
ncbi:helix-turn-helix transcriptional regulator [Comamonas composti]|uniref:helix-turn-helix transcriptional regulator n=1 Tax=Comamonas composti TaxID=408558 RepID=UPI0003F65740|nr:LuxR C-terminal-related transcriptional regulator [Comamonas composti]